MVPRSDLFPAVTLFLPGSCCNTYSRLSSRCFFITLNQGEDLKISPLAAMTSGEVSLWDRVEPRNNQPSFLETGLHRGPSHLHTREKLGEKDFP